MVQSKRSFPWLHFGGLVGELVVTNALPRLSLLCFEDEFVMKFPKRGLGVPRDQSSGSQALKLGGQIRTLTVVNTLSLALLMTPYRLHWIG